MWEDTASFYPSVPGHGQHRRVQHAPSALEPGRLQLRVSSQHGFFFLAWQSGAATQEDGTGLSPSVPGHNQVRSVQHTRANAAYVQNTLRP